MNKTLLYIWTCLLIALPTQALAFGDKFSFDGVLTSAGSPMVGTPNIKIQIRSENGNCLLFEETHSAVALGADGSFSVLVGDGVRSSSVIDGGLSFSTIFKSTGVVRTHDSGTCMGGYTAAVGDNRKLRVFVDNGTPVQLAPDYVLAATPAAKVAETIDGISSSQLLQVNAGQNLSQTNLEGIFSGGNLSALNNLIAGTSALYMKNAPVAAVSMNSQRVTNVAAPTAATDAANKNYVDSFVGGKAADTVGIAALAGADAGKVMVWDGTQWTAAVASGDSTKLALVGGTMTGAINMSNNNILSVANIGIGTASPVAPLDIYGSLPNSAVEMRVFDDNAQGTSRYVAGGNGASGNLSLEAHSSSASTWYGASAAGDARARASGTLYWSGNNPLNIAAGGGGASYLRFYTGGDTSGNERMRIDSSGNVGIGTTAPASKLDVKGTLRLSGATSGYVGFAPAAVAGSTTYTLPNADGTSGYVLSTNGSGALSWVSPVSSNSVDTSAIADANVTLPKLAADSVNSSKIVDGSVGASDIAAGAVSLATHVSGVLPVANGGTGATSLGAAGIFVNGGSSFAGTATIGTNDNNLLTFETNNSARMTIDTAGQVTVTGLVDAGAFNTMGGTYKLGGQDAMKAPGGGAGNFFAGLSAGQMFAGGSGNTALGNQALNQLGSSSDNTALGGQTLLNLSSGNGNIAIGSAAMDGLASASYNTVIGTGAGQDLITGSGNVFIGRNAGNTLGNMSNSLVIANNSGSPLIYGDFSSKRIALGNMAPSALFEVKPTAPSTLTSGSLWHVNSDISASPASPSTAIFTAYRGNVSNTGTNALNGAVTAFDGTIQNSSNGSIATPTGVRGAVTNGVGTLTTATGVYGRVINSGSGTTTNGVGVYGEVMQSSGTVTNAYGVKIGNVQGTNKWSVYASDAAASSYFAGNVGIGTTAPRTALDVVGAIAGKPATSVATGTVDFITGNLQYTTNNCQVFNLFNMKDGAEYMFVVQGATPQTCSFSAYSDAGVTGLTVHMPVGHGATTSSTHTVYRFSVLGTHVYVSWQPGV